MNLGVTKSRELAVRVAAVSADIHSTDIWLAPSFGSIAAVSEALRGTALKVGAQNVHWAASGAFTGEISVAMLTELGCSFSIIGHSERRTNFGETNESAAERALAAIRGGLTAVFCIGERLAEREAGQTEAVLQRQLEQLFQGLHDDALRRRLVLAYEPVWAIGTGKVAAADDINQVASFLLTLWGQHFSTPAPRILYGGGIDLDNFKGIIRIPHIVGALVGNASLSEKKFPALVRMAEDKSLSGA